MLAWTSDAEVGCSPNPSGSHPERLWSDASKETCAPWLPPRPLSHTSHACTPCRIRTRYPSLRASLAPPVIKPSDKAAYEARPMVDGRKILLDGKVLPWNGAVQEVFAPIYKVSARSGDHDHARHADALPQPAVHASTNLLRLRVIGCLAGRDGGEGTHWPPGAVHGGGLGRCPRCRGQELEERPRRVGADLACWPHC